MVCRAPQSLSNAHAPGDRAHPGTVMHTHSLSMALHGRRAARRHHPDPPRTRRPLGMLHSAVPDTPFSPRAHHAPRRVCRTPQTPTHRDPPWNIIPHISCTHFPWLCSLHGRSPKSCQAPPRPTPHAAAPRHAPSRQCGVDRCSGVAHLKTATVSGTSLRCTWKRPPPISIASTTLNFVPG